MSDYAALIGIDWADTKHDICFINPETEQREASILRHSSQTIDEWAAALRVRFGGQPVAVCLEQSRGPLIFALMKYDFLTLYPVNPQTLSKYREALRAKGKSHQAATRALAFKWIRIIYKCWKSRTAYDEVKYLESLRRKGSSLLTYAASNPA